jgi:aryl-alcohol dehydrogenase-like predicted oxidoreductase
MQTQVLGKTKLVVSRAALGTMTFGSQADEACAASMLDFALDNRINLIDTANVYTGGESERILGKLLRGRRDKVVLATKVGNRVGSEPDQTGLSPKAIERGVTESLRRLQTDYIDLYYFHQPDRTTPLEESLDAIDRLVKSGKVRHLGASNYAAWQVCQMLSLAKEQDAALPTVVQPMYNLLARGIEQEFLPMCAAFGLGVVAYNPLAGGLLTGKHSPAGDSIQGTRFDTMPVYKDRYWHSDNFEAVETLSQIARGANRSLISLALQWLMDQPGITCIILGASKLEQLQQNVAGMEDGPLPAEALAACNEVWTRLRGVSPQYNR